MAEQRLLELRFDCGATWLNLLATRGRAFGKRPVERLYSTARLGEWLARSELAPDRDVNDADLERALALREALRALALPTVAGEAPPADAAAAVAGFLADHDDPVHLAVGDRLVRPAPATATAALARVARQAADHLTGPERHTLKSCPEVDCRGVFTDSADRRRWCPSPACASRGRVRALRARRGEAQAEEESR